MLVEQKKAALLGRASGEMQSSDQHITADVQLAIIKSELHEAIDEIERHAMKGILAGDETYLAEIRHLAIRCREMLQEVGNE